MVTDAEAASKYVRGVENRGGILDHHDWTPLVQAFAAHREAAERAGARAGLEAAAKALEGGSFLHDEAPGARLAREAARAIRAIDPSSVSDQERA